MWKGIPFTVIVYIYVTAHVQTIQIFEIFLCDLITSRDLRRDHTQFFLHMQSILYHLISSYIILYHLISSY